jgi:hypothetical protein
VVGHILHSDLEQRVARRAQRHGSHDVRRSGLIALGNIGPDQVLEGDELDCPAPVQQGLTHPQAVAVPTSAPAPKGAYSL